MVISPLRRKVFRDLRRLWAQVLAIALVLAAGVATLILGNGAYASLFQTRAQYYEDYRFADVFADVTRAPLALLGDIREIDGVLAAEARITKLGLLDLPTLTEPGAVQLVTMPGGGPGALNQLYLRQGRLPDPQSANEAVISESFAKAHRLRPGSDFSVLMDGQARKLMVTGIVLSPEFIYAIGPGEMMPDPRRFGIVWMTRPSLEAAFDLDGAFSNVVIKLAPGADADRVIERLDQLLEPYGGVGAISRKDQLSNVFLDAELKQMRAMVRVLPTIFLVVAAMLVNMTLSRLITLEREQIGLLKAIGYTPRAVALHYVEFVAMIGVLGVLIGFVAGTWLGAGMATMYARFFTFPFLVFSRDPALYTLAAVITIAAAVAGALYAVRSVIRLAPAVAMSPPAPAAYRQRLGALRRLLRLPQTTVMVVRHLLRWPFRTVTSTLGIAMAVAVLATSQWASGSIDYMVDISFFRAERQDATMVFAGNAPTRAVHAAANLPGVMRAEPFRMVAARISHQNQSRRLGVIGRPEVPSVSRLLGLDLRPMTLPDAGVILSEALAEALQVGPGDQVTLEFLEGRRVVTTVPVSGISVGYMGLSATMRLDRLNDLIDEGDVISGVNLLIDEAQGDAFYAAGKAAPKTSILTVKALSLGRFRATLAENIAIMSTIYIVLATIIAVGVVYNFSRISLSEQGRELASLRVLGFTRAEVAGVLFGELAVVVLLAQPVGWLIGYGLAVGMVATFSSDLYRIPLIINRDVYSTATLVVLLAALASAWLMRGRINNLDMIEVLKTRE
jgi:putative ABC transport system permease protein